MKRRTGVRKMSETVNDAQQEKTLIEFDVQLEPKDLYRFNIHQAYTGLQGWTAIILGVLAFVMAAITFGKTDAGIRSTIIYIVAGLFFFFYIPVSLWSRSKITLKANAVLAGVLHYEVSEENIRVTQGEEEGVLPWEAVYKLVSNKNQILIYSTRINAYIIPREQIGTKYDGLCEVAKKKLESYRLKLKG